VPSRHDPTDCLAEMIENIEYIGGYVAGTNRDAFEHDRRTRDAVGQCLERICEAAFRLDTAVALMPAQPWNDIRGMAIGFATAMTRLMRI
jgi:uncharacterized protein with HEPN domain